MAFVVDTVRLMLAWSKGELLTAAALTMVLVGPGVACCWLAYHLSAVRLAAGATRVTRFRARRRRADRIDQRLASLCTAMTILTDSTESGLRQTITVLERLSGAAPAAADASVATPPQAIVATHQGRSARDIAIAEGVSEGEVRLRMRLQEAC